MANIDERIVSMKFDNAQFENGVSTSISSIDKLKQALQFNDSNKGFDNLTKAAQNVDLSAIQNGIENIQQRFSVAGIAMTKTITDITAKVEGIFVDPLRDGFSEYELKMDSVQTIMASTGASLEEVNGYLDELNVYADKTIYSFSDMTASIGKFTNAGVELGDAVAAIQGISNEAAISGANTNEASRAMYNFAQALSAGSVKLIDWKSIENANMATVEFKQNLIDTAVELGTVEQAADGMYYSLTTDNKGSYSDAFDAVRSFNDSLSYQWMTTDVLVETLKRYTDETTELGKKAYAAAQDVKTWSQLIDTLKEALGSGWTNTFELIVGDYNEAKELFTMISDVLSNIIDRSSDLRNNFVQLWRDKGGRDAFISSLKVILNSIESIYDFTESIGDWLTVAFESHGSFLDGLIDISENEEEIVEEIKGITEDEKRAARDIWFKGSYGAGEERRNALEKLGLSYENVQSYLEKFIITGKEETETTEESTDTLNKQNRAVKKNSKSIDMVLSGMEKSGVSDLAIKLEYTAYNISRIIGGVASIVTNIGKTIGNVFTIIKNSFLDYFAFDTITADVVELVDIITYATEWLADFTQDNETLIFVFDSLFSILSLIWDVAANIFFTIGDTISNIIGYIYSIIDAIIEWATSLDENSLIFRAWDAITTIVSNLAVAIGEIKDAFLGGLGFGEAEKDVNMFEVLRNVLTDAAQSGFETVVNWLENVSKMDFTNLEKFQVIKDLAFGAGEGLKKIFEGLRSGLTKVIRFFIDEEGNVVLFENLSNAANTAFEKSQETATKAKAWAGVIGDNVIEGLGMVDWSKVLQFGSLLLMALQALKISSIFSKSANILGAVTDTIETFTEGVKGVFGAWKQNLQSQWLATIALMILSIAAAFYVFTGMDERKMIEAGLIMIGILFVLKLLIEAISKILDNNSVTDAVEAQPEKPSTKLGQLGIMMLGVGVALMAIVKSIKDVMALEGDVWQAVGVVSAVLGLLTIMGILLNVISSEYKDAKFGTMLGLGIMFILMAQAVKSIGAAITIISKAISGLSEDTFLTVFAVIEAILATFAILILASSASKVKVSTVLGLAVMFIALSAAINMLIPFMITASYVNPQGLDAMFTIFNGLFSIIAMIAGATFLKKNFVDNILKMVTAITLIAMALAALEKTGALEKLMTFMTTTFDGENWGGVAEFATVVIIITGALALLAIVAQKYSAGFLALALYLIGMGAAFLIFAAAIAVLEGVIIMLPAAAEALSELADHIKYNGPKLLKAFAAVVALIGTGVIIGIVAIKGRMLAAIALLLISILTMLVDYKDSITDVLRLVFITVIDFLIDIIDILAAGIFRFLLKLLINVALLLANNIGPLIKALELIVKIIFLSLGKIVMTLLEDLALMIVESIGGIAIALADKFGVADYVTDTYSDIVDTITGAFSIYGDGYDAAIQSINKEGEDLLKEVDKANGTTAEAIDEMKKSVKKDFSNLKKEATKDSDGLFDGIGLSIGNGTGKLSETLDKGLGDILNVSDIGVGNINESLSNLGLPLSQGEFKVGTMEELGDLMGEGQMSSYVNTLQNGQGELFDANELMAEMGAEGFENFDWNNLGIEAVEQVEEPFNADNNEAVEMGGELGKAIAKELEDVGKPRAYQAGKQLIEGERLGMLENQYKVINAMRDISNKVIETAENAFKVQSPSRVMMGIGRYLDLGLAKGITDNEENVTNATKSMAKNTIKSLSKPLSEVANVVNDDFVEDPTIRPVMDLTDVKNGVEESNKMLNGFGVKSLNNVRENNTVLKSENVFDSTYDDKNVINSITSLKEEIVNLKSSMNNLNVVMDSGTLVGSIAPKIDNELGRRKNLLARRV